MPIMVKAVLLISLKLVCNFCGNIAGLDQPHFFLNRQLLLIYHNMQCNVSSRTMNKSFIECRLGQDVKIKSDTVTFSFS